MEVLFSLLSNFTIYILHIDSSNLYQWFGYINKIGPSLRELLISQCKIELTIFTTIAEKCPYLEKLSICSLSGVSKDITLQSIAKRCQHLRSLYIFVGYSICPDADLTAFAEKCPQLEELTLHCPELTDQCVIALAQHCSRLKRLTLDYCSLSFTSLIALSERGLPLEELDIPRIPIPSAEIAALCAHALSRIRELNTRYYSFEINDSLYIFPYMTGLRELHLDSKKDHLMVPQLLLLLQQGHCTGLKSLTIHHFSSITPTQCNEILKVCYNLHTLCNKVSTCISNAELIELARNCPQLKKITLCSSKLTEKGLLTLATHCRQLKEINLPQTILTEETVRQLARHHSRLKILTVWVCFVIDEYPVHKNYTNKDIIAMRISESIVTHRCINTCVIL